MKRISVVLALLVVAASAFAVSGKIYMRYGTSGPMWSYWGAANNVDLWQGKDGTGFDVNTESLGITYRTREQYTMPYSLYGFDYTENTTSTASNTKATSPGYLQLRDIKIGKLAMSVGIAWWQMFGNYQLYQTNTNNVTNNNIAKNTTYNRVYLDYKFVLGLSDSIVIKQVDWEQMHFEYDMGSMAEGKVGNVSNVYKGGTSLLAHIPLRIFVTMDRLNLDISPKFTYWSVGTGYNYTGNSNVTTSYSRMRVGGTAAVSYGLSDSLSVYLEPGVFYSTAFQYDTTLGWFGTSRGLITNTCFLTTITEIPLFAGLKVKVGPGINMMLGYGYNIAFKTEINYINSNTNKVDTVMPRYGFFNFNWSSDNGFLPTEFNYYGDTFMDFGFIKFGGDVAFAQNWTLGIQAGVALNDKWSYWWDLLGTRGQTTTTTATSVTVDYGAQLFSFNNLMNYDNNMYIKYEDDKVAIKGTLFDKTGTATGKLLSLFSYLDFTIKF